MAAGHKVSKISSNCPLFSSVIIKLAATHPPLRSRMAAKQIVRPIFDNPFLNISFNPLNNTVERPPEPRNPPNPDPNTNSSVLSKDVALDPNHKTWLRLYIPNSSAPPPPPSAKLPLIFYYHGGGFVFCNADSSFYDVFCKGLVEKLGVMVISLDYRLAPEHRLPAAYDDAVHGFHWVKNTDDDWIAQFADLGNCYLCGTSAGGNLAYHAGLRFAATAGELEPLIVRGMILHHPYFSGTKRTGSEQRLADDPLLPLYAIDQMFDLSLPEGVDHDHEYSNPMANGGSEGLGEIRRLGWRVMVTGCFDDPLVDAGVDCAEVLEAKGVETLKFFGDGYHGMEVFDPTMSGPLYDAIKEFVFPCAT